MKNFYVYIIMFLFTFTISGSAYSANISWTGNGSSPVWGDPANWDCNCLPGMDDDVTIGDGLNPIYVNFGQPYTSINSILLQNAELELQLDLTVLDFAEIDEQSTITFTYYSSETYSKLSVEYLFFFGTVNMYYNNVPEEGASLSVFDYGEVDTDCGSIFTGVGIGDGFDVYQELYCEAYDDGYGGPPEIDFGPLEVYDVEYYGTTLKWVGGAGDDLWHNPENWPTSVVPGVDDVAILSDGDEVVALQAIDVKQVLMGVDSKLEINAGFSSEFYTWIDESATLTWKGGILSRSNTSQQNIIFNYGVINIETAAMKKVENGLIIDNIAPSVFLYDYGKVNIQENVIITTDGNNNELRNRGGEIVIEGDNQNIYFDEILNFGTIVKNSGSGTSILLAEEDSFINYNDVKSSSGILTIGNNIDNQGRLSGNGSFDFEFADGTPKLLRGGITPGNSPGALTFVNCPILTNSTFVMELQGTSAGTHFDQLIVLDDINLDGGVLNVQKPAWYNPQDGDQYKIVTSTGNITGTFNTVVYPDMSDNWSIAYNNQDIVVTFGTSVPVELVDIQVTEKDLGNELVWNTASEINSQDFIIEVSDDAVSWQDVGKVKCQGSEITGATYSFLHRSTENKAFYYRLRMRDLDGTFEYSKVVSVTRRGGEAEFAVFPNPANNFIRLIHDKRLKEVQIFGVDGKTVKFLKDFDQSVDISDLLPGIYFISATDINNYSFKAKFIKNQP